MMKFVFAALAVLAVSTPINAYELPRVGSGALADTLQDFVDLIPFDKIVTIIVRYLAEDREFGTLVTYLKSEEFKSLIRDTEALPEVVDLLNYIQRGGLDVYHLVNKLNKFLGLPNMKAPNTFQVYVTGGIRGFLDDVEALIPVPKLKALYKQKMSTSKIFADLMARLRSPDMQKITNAVVANPNLTAILQKAEKAGIDNKAVVEFLERFLGIKIPIDTSLVSLTGAAKMRIQLAALTALLALASSSALPAFGQGPLYDDVMYFMDMVPIQQIGVITLKYAAQDREFQELLRYVKGAEFKQMVQELEAIPEYHNFATYMQKNGVYLVDMTNKLNERLGLPNFTPMDLYRTNGLKGYWEEVKAKVSYDQFIHGYVYKMRTSSAFRGFVAHLKSDNHQKFVNKMYSNQKYLNFRNMVSSRGIDVALIEDIIYTVLGIEFPALKNFEVATFSNPELGKDIKDFLNLLDMNKIMEIVISYMDDDQIQTAFEYIYSEEFHVLVRQVEAMKEYQELVLYLEDAGLDMFGLLQRVHKLFGMEDYVPPKPQLYYETTFVNKGGIKKLVDDVIAVLPRDKIKALYYEKMANSPAFKNFMQKIRSEDFKHIVNLVYSSPVFREMRAKVIAAGIDLAPIKELIKQLIGYDLPDVPMRLYLFDKISDHSGRLLLLCKQLLQLIYWYNSGQVLHETLGSSAMYALMIWITSSSGTRSTNSCASLASAPEPAAGTWYALEGLATAKSAMAAIAGAEENIGHDALMKRSSNSFDFSIVNSLRKLPEYLTFCFSSSFSSFSGIVWRILSIITVNPPVATSLLFLTYLGAIFQATNNMRNQEDAESIGEVIVGDSSFISSIVYVSHMDALDGNLADFLVLRGLDFSENIFEHGGVLFLLVQQFLDLLQRHDILQVVQETCDSLATDRLALMMLTTSFSGTRSTMSCNSLARAPEPEAGTFQAFRGLAIAKRAKAASTNFICENEMKFAATVLSLLALATSLTAYKLPAVGSGELARDLQDILDLVPLDKAAKIVRAYLAQDNEFRTSLDILKSPELNAFVRDVEASPELADLAQFMQGAGLDAYTLLKGLNEALARRSHYPRDMSETEITGGLAGFAKDFGALVPTSSAQALVDEKLAAGGVFAEYFRKCLSQKFVDFYFKAGLNVHFQILIREAQLKNIDSTMFEQLFPYLLVIRVVMG
ncbi:uncharacterized protein LOC143357334 [Halictus rubicundus]|uniref:uncharacterized protein LOC143357334 n=1 Tax=Halictus rubicundus TaxID=77578 RepID=UPI0040368C18